MSYALNIDDSIKNDGFYNGFYLSIEQMDLISIVEAKDGKELVNFILDCEQINHLYDRESLNSILSMNDISEIKKEVFKKYQETYLDRSIVGVSKDETYSVMSSDGEIKLHRCFMPLHNSLVNAGLNRDEWTYLASIYEEYVLDKGITDKYALNKIMKYYLEELVDNYKRVISIKRKLFRFRSLERDQVKEVSYDDIVLLSRNLDDCDTILTDMGKPYFVINNLFDDLNSSNSDMIDMYFPNRVLSFIRRHNKKVRYHSLLIRDYDINDYRTYEKYITKTIDFINVKGIEEVDLFNEIVNFPNEENSYSNIYGNGRSWFQLLKLFQYAKNNKKKSVRYLYNEPFLENRDRRKVVLNELSKLLEGNEEGLIDTLGYQMHISFYTSLDDLKECFRDLKEFSDKYNINVEITEFDLCLNDLNKLNNSEEEIRNYKQDMINNIIAIINESGIKLSGISYWSLIDKMDHNLERIRDELYISGKDEEAEKIDSVYSGLYSSSKRIDLNEGLLI